MFRLFVAIRPSAAQRDALLSVMGGVECARWQSDEQLHLTLSFIGEVDTPVADDVLLTLSALSHPPVNLVVAGGGVFEKGGRVNTLWAGVAADAGLSSLQAKVDRAVRRAGVEPQARAWKPHITLARGRMGADARIKAMMMEGLSVPGETITSFGLYESRLGQGGAHYSLIQSFTLAGAPPDAQ